MSYQRYRLTARRRFFRDAIVYTLFGIVLMQLSMLFFPRYWYLPFIGWSAGFLLQYFNVFIRDIERDIFYDEHLSDHDTGTADAEYPPRRRSPDRLDLYDLSRMPEEQFQDDDMI
jgi:hypothetical protein